MKTRTSFDQILPGYSTTPLGERLARCNINIYCIYTRICALADHSRPVGYIIATPDTVSGMAGS